MPITTAYRPPAGFPVATAFTNWVALLAALVAPLVVAGLIKDAPHVPRITITNTTAYQLDIFASTPTDAMLSLVTIIDPGETQDALEVVDRGASWILHFRASGCEARPVEVARADLTDGPYTIPGIVGRDLGDMIQGHVCR